MCIYFSRVVSRFLSSQFHPKSRWLFPCYFSNIILRTDLLTFSVTGAVFKIASKMRWLLACFDNPVLVEHFYYDCFACYVFQDCLVFGRVVRGSLPQVMKS